MRAWTRQTLPWSAAESDALLAALASTVSPDGKGDWSAALERGRARGGVLASNGRTRVDLRGRARIMSKSKDEGARLAIAKALAAARERPDARLLPRKNW